MTAEQLAIHVLEACEAVGVDHMLTGAFATNTYGIPRSTKDVDVVVNMTGGDPIAKVVARLGALVVFDGQVQFDTLTWGKRLVGTAADGAPLKVELFELFDDPFVLSQFGRKREMRDVLAVQGPETLDMDYIRGWCREHGTMERLQNALDQIPPLD